MNKQLTYSGTENILEYSVRFLKYLKCTLECSKGL